MTVAEVMPDWKKGDGLVPAIVQHAITGRVLMLGYMNAEALTTTRLLNRVTFFSRSKKRLWTKGETSGNWLELKDIEIDCDRDAFLVTAIPSGPTCHLDAVSCFDCDSERPGYGFVGKLEEVIRERMDDQSRDSYTARLIKAGVPRIAQKIGEEGVELALAAVHGNKREVIGEAADLVYHLLVLLQSQQMEFSDVVSQLEHRHREKVTDR